MFSFILALVLATDGRGPPIPTPSTYIHVPMSQAMVPKSTEHARSHHISMSIPFPLSLFPAVTHSLPPLLTLSPTYQSHPPKTPCVPPSSRSPSWPPSPWPRTRPPMAPRLSPGTVPTLVQTVSEPTLCPRLMKRPKRPLRVMAAVVTLTAAGAAAAVGAALARVEVGAVAEAPLVRISVYSILRSVSALAMNNS